MSTLLTLGVLSFGVLLFLAATSVFATSVPYEAFALGGVLAGGGTLVAAYGVREFLRASGGGYYCCNHLYYQSLGALVTVVGWAVILFGVSLTRQRRDGA